MINFSMSEKIAKTTSGTGRSLWGKLTFRNLKKFTWMIVRGVLVIGICYLILYPMFVKFTISFMDEKDLYDSTVKYIPKKFTLANYRMAIEGMKYLTSLRNTLILVGSTSLIQLASCAFAAYGFARFKFPFRKILFFMVILFMVVPPQTIMTPLYMIFRYFDMGGLIPLFTGRKHVNLIGTFWPLILLSATCTGFKNGLFIFIFRQHFRSIPKELEEAAYIDGCGSIRTFFRIILPSSFPIITTIFLFSFAWLWTDNFYTTLFLSNTKVLSTALGSLAQNLWQIYDTSGLGQMTFISPGFRSIVNNAGTILVITPLLVLYLIAQKSFIEGVERSGIVG